MARKPSKPSQLRLTPERGRDLREFVMIVLGVLVALALGALATEIGWRLEVRAARIAVRSELAFNFAGLDQAERQLTCADNRLEEIGAILAEATRTRRLPPLGNIGRPVAYGWQRGVWESQIAADTAAHYPSEEAAGLSRVYGKFAVLGEIDADSARAWNVLQMLSGPGRPLDPGTESELYAALALARTVNWRTGRHTAFTRQILRDALGDEYPRYADGRRPAMLRVLHLCRPIEQRIPPTYGSPLPSPAEAAEFLTDSAAP